MALGFGRLTGYLTTVLRDGDTEQTVPLSGTIRLTPMTTHVVVSGGDPPTIVLPSPITIAVVNGHIEDDAQNQWVDVLATNLPDASPPEFFYKAEFSLSYENLRVRFGPFTIVVPEGQTVDLADVTPIPNQTNTYVPGMLNNLRGPKGKSSYEIAVDHGYAGTEAEFAASLLPPVLILGPSDPVPTNLDGYLVARLLS